MRNNPTYFALLEACEQIGCPVCRVVQQSVERYLDSLFYEHVNDGWVRRDLRKSLGFCHAHAWLVLDKGLGDALGVAIIYHDILGAVLKRLPQRALPVESKTGLRAWLRRAPRRLVEQLEQVRRALTPQELCPACKQRENSTQTTLQVLMQSLADEAMIAALETSSGLCLPHLKAAIEMVADSQELDLILSISRGKLARLDSELAEFIRKNDYRFRDEGFGPERDSWRRAMQITVGEGVHKP